MKGLAALAGAAGLCAYDARLAAAEPPPETTRIRLSASPAICAAPQWVAEELLKQEGFTEVEYLKVDRTGDDGAFPTDVDLLSVGQVITDADAGGRWIALLGVHLGCYELFGTERVRAIRDLKGKAVPVDGVGGPTTHLPVYDGGLRRA